MQNPPKPFYGNETSQNDAMRKAKAEALLKTNDYMNNLGERGPNQPAAEQGPLANRYDRYKVEPYSWVGQDENGFFDNRDGSRLYTRETMPDDDPRKGKPLFGNYFRADSTSVPTIHWGGGLGQSLGGGFNSTPDQRSSMHQQMERGMITGGPVGSNPSPDDLRRHMQQNMARAPSILGGGNNILGNAFSNPVKKLR